MGFASGSAHNASRIPGPNVQAPGPFRRATVTAERSGCPYQGGMQNVAGLPALRHLGRHPGSGVA